MNRREEEDILRAGRARIPVSHHYFLKLAFGALAAAALISFALGLTGASGKEYRLVLLSAVIIGVMTFAAWLMKGGRKLDFFEPYNVLFALLVIFFPLRLILAIILGEGLYAAKLSAFNPTLTACLLAFLSFLIGYRNRRLARALAVGMDWLLTPLDGEWDDFRTNLVVIGLLLVALVSLLVISWLGGSAFFLIQIGAASKTPFDMPYWYYYSQWGVDCAIVAGLMHFTAYLRYRRQPLWTMICIGMATVFAALVSRGTLAIFFFLVLGLVNYVRKKVGPVMLSWLGVAALVWLVAGGMLRERVSFDVTNTSSVSTMLENQVLSDLDHVFTVTTLMQNMPDVIPWQYGSTFLVILYKPIPRSVMPSKPLGASGILNKTLWPYAYDAGYSKSATMIGELYMNFSWAGIILGMALIGIGSSALYRCAGKARSPGRVLIYLICLVGLVSWTRNDLQAASTDFLFLLLPTLAGLWFVAGGRSKSRRASPYRTVTAADADTVEKVKATYLGLSGPRKGPVHHANRH